MLFTQSRVIEKAAPRGERARIEELIAGQEAAVRRAFRRFLDDVRSNAVRREVRLALERGNAEAALRIMDSYVVRFGSVFTSVFQESAAAEAEALARQMGRSRAGVAIDFDPSYPRAAEMMRRSRLEFVREFTRTQREATRAALTEALQLGVGPIQTARAFRDSIGLTEHQRGVVANYRNMLEMGDRTALTRDLRDRRFDSSVQRLLAEGESLGAERITRMVEQYRARYLQYRAEAIARTETLRIIGRAREEALAQVLEQVGLSQEAVIRTWRATQDARTRDTHISMDGQERGKNEAFNSPSGAQMMFPGDGSLGAPADELINCRCVVVNSIGVPSAL